MGRQHGRGGKPFTHEQGFEDAVYLIERHQFPSSFTRIVGHLIQFTATYIRAQLLAAVRFNWISEDLAEAAYQELRRRIGRHWLCVTLFMGRGW